MLFVIHIKNIFHFPLFHVIIKVLSFGKVGDAVFDFDRIWDRTQIDNNKWRACTNGEIPMWVADMDFAAPAPILDALKARLEHPFFGYDSVSVDALKTVAEHYRNTYGCRVEDDWFVLIPSVMPGVNMGCMAAGGGIMYCTPMYMHIRRVGKETGLPVTEVPMQCRSGRYELDFEAMERAVTPETRSFILCSPHNPVGRVFGRDELTDLISFCRRHHLTLISDEIHCELTLDGAHIPLFSACDDALKGTVTVSSNAKICNIPRIPIGFAIIPDPELRDRYQACGYGLFGRGATLNGLALEKAYDGSCAGWKDALRNYLRSNRDYSEGRITAMPCLSASHTEGTYFTWIDCSALGLDDPCAFFKEEAKVILSPGAAFGNGQFVRLNFACPRAQLKEALDRIETAVHAVQRRL